MDKLYSIINKARRVLDIYILGSCIFIRALASNGEPISDEHLRWICEINNFVFNYVEKELKIVLKGI